MTPAEARAIRRTASKSVTDGLTKALQPFIGREASDVIRALMGRRTRPLVSGARTTLAKLATQQYLTFLDGGKPLKPAKLTRFTPDSWQGSLNKALDGDNETPVHVIVTQDHVEEIVRKGEHWANDAERGTLIDYAMRDARIGGWARIDPIPPTCPFCTVLISIGPTRSDPQKAHFHTGDTCEVVLAAPGQTDYEGADQVAAAQKIYKRAAKQAGSTSLAQLVAAIKNLDPEG